MISSSPGQTAVLTHFSPLLHPCNCSFLPSLLPDALTSPSPSSTSSSSSPPPLPACSESRALRVLVGCLQAAQERSDVGGEDGTAEDLDIVRRAQEGRGRDGKEGRWGEQGMKTMGRSTRGGEMKEEEEEEEEGGGGGGCGGGGGKSRRRVKLSHLPSPRACDNSFVSRGHANDALRHWLRHKRGCKEGGREEL
eukprot:756964-Hanusia_phi.AAC.1